MELQRVPLESLSIDWKTDHWDKIGQQRLQVWVARGNGTYMVVKTDCGQSEGTGLPKLFSLNNSVFSAGMDATALGKASIWFCCN
jgi:hypothetical protein